MTDLSFMAGGFLVALVWSFLRGRRSVINKRYRDDARTHKEVSEAVSRLDSGGNVDDKLHRLEALR